MLNIGNVFKITDVDVAIEVAPFDVAAGLGDFVIDASATAEIGRGDEPFEVSMKGVVDAAKETIEFSAFHAGGWSPFQGPSPVNGSLREKFTSPQARGYAKFSVGGTRVYAAFDVSYPEPLALLPDVIEFFAPAEREGESSSSAAALANSSAANMSAANSTNSSAAGPYLRVTVWQNDSSCSLGSAPYAPPPAAPPPLSPSSNASQAALVLQPPDCDDTVHYEVSISAAVQLGNPKHAGTPPRVGATGVIRSEGTSRLEAFTEDEWTLLPNSAFNVTVPRLYGNITFDPFQGNGTLQARGDTRPIYACGGQGRVLVLIK